MSPKPQANPIPENSSVSPSLDTTPPSQRILIEPIPIVSSKGALRQLNPPTVKSTAALIKFDLNDSILTMSVSKPLKETSRLSSSCITWLQQALPLPLGCTEWLHKTLCSLPSSPYDVAAKQWKGLPMTNAAKNKAVEASYAKFYTDLLKTAHGRLTEQYPGKFQVLWCSCFLTSFLISLCRLQFSGKKRMVCGVCQQTHFLRWRKAETGSGPPEEPRFSSRQLNI